MSYQSTVYRVLIASPSDVEEEREIMSRIIQDWNDLNSFSKKIVILPVKWETHTAPIYGIRPQESINRQIVDECDLLIGFFWTRIGSPTGEELSGTIEEIKRVSKSGKPVMLYFSKRGKDPSLIDLKQLELLNQFKSDVYSIALVETFNSLLEFKDKVSRQLEMKIRELQSKNQATKDLLSLSTIDILTGELQPQHVEISHERVIVNDKKIKEALDQTPEIQGSWHFQNAMRSFLNKKNNIPIVFGVKNNVNRLFQNIHLEIKLTSSIENELIVTSSDENAGSKINSRISQIYLSDEDESNIRKLLSEDFIQTSSKSWLFQIKPFALRPNKMKGLKPFVLLNPKESMKIEIKMILLSENILNAIENSGTISIRVSKREISNEEISEIVTKAKESEEELLF